MADVCSLPKPRCRSCSRVSLLESASLMQMSQFSLNRRGAESPRQRREELLILNPAVGFRLILETRSPGFSLRDPLRFSVSLETSLQILLFQSRRWPAQNSRPPGRPFPRPWPPAPGPRLPARYETARFLDSMNAGPLIGAQGSALSSALRFAVD